MNTKKRKSPGRVLPLMLCCAMLFFFPGCIPKRAAPVYSFGHIDTVMVVRVGSLNFRKCPSVQCRILTTLHRGEKVVVLQEEGAWVQVQRLLDDAEGWVAVKYLDELEEDTPEPSAPAPVSGETPPERPGNMVDMEVSADSGAAEVLDSEEFAPVDDDVEAAIDGSPNVEELPREEISVQEEIPEQDTFVPESGSELTGVEDEFADVAEEVDVERQEKVDSSPADDDLPQESVPAVSDQEIEEEFAE